MATVAIVDESSTLELLQSIDIKYISHYDHCYLWAKVLKCQGWLVSKLLRFKRGPSGLPFAYSQHGVLFLLQNFHVKNFYFQSQFSHYHIALYGDILLIILRVP